MKSSSQKKSLIIVESPTKARTIQKFLGNDFSIHSSYGHIRDLPKTKFGVDVENNFEPQFIISSKFKKTMNLLKNEAKKAGGIILATDEDREGESIAFHLKEALALDERYKRIVFHEITKSAIKEALLSPRKIDIDLVHAQFGRRVLDRIVGYKLSPFLWKKIAKGLSAGRVQSVAVRLVVEREKEIKDFIKQEYWTIEALLEKITDSKPHISEKSQVQNKGSGDGFAAILTKKDGNVLPKLGIKNRKGAENIIEDLKGAKYKVSNIEKKELKRNPPPPFITSSLQQEAWKKLRFPAKKTMFLAQNLYERGFITYHRTDSLNISNLALAGAKELIGKSFGKDYWQFRKFKTKSKTAQEAHEAIRPTYPQNSADKIKKESNLEKNQIKLYELIWRRFIASQMRSAVFDFQKVEIQAKNYIFQSTGQSLKFDGFLKIYPVSFTENELPVLKINEGLFLKKLIPRQHFTQPPPRYTEATLIRALEEKGIGRPSTYAPTISTIQERNYIQKIERGALMPTEIAIIVNNLLVEHFPNIVDINFTAKMEEELDEIARGKIKWQDAIKKFYHPFEKNLNKKGAEISKKEIAQEKTDKICPECGSPIVIKLGRFGKFYACNKFPDCKYSKSLEANQLNIKCPKCKSAEIVEKRTRKGKIFYGCPKYPQCDFATWNKPTGEFCKKCGWVLVKTKREQIKCANPKCADLEK